MTGGGHNRPMPERPADLIRDLKLNPHPEGGHFREIYRAEESVWRQEMNSSRRAATSIFYLLQAGEKSRWHWVRSDELWHFYEGEPIELFDLDPSGPHLRRLILGPAGPESSPCQLIPAGHWQAARPLGAYALLGCTVAPGFDYADYMLISELTGEWKLIHSQFPEYANLL